MFYCTTGWIACTTESHPHIKCIFSNGSTYVYYEAFYKEGITQDGKLNNVMACMYVMCGMTMVWLGKLNNVVKDMNQ